MLDDSTESTLVSIDALHDKLHSLTLKGLGAIERSEFGIEGCRNAIAFFDSKRDELVLNCPSFQVTAESLASTPDIAMRFGAGEATRLAIQFVFNACGQLGSLGTADAAFAETFVRFKEEVERPHWTYRAVANVQNLECASLPVVLDDGISIRARSFDQLSRLLNWGPAELEYLGSDWRTGGHGSNVLLVETRAAKTPDNFLLEDDGYQYSRASRMLLAMRLVAPGDIRIGRMFAARPAAFNVGIGGLLSYGSSHWHPGPAYNLTSSDIPLISSVYRDLLLLENKPPKSNRNLKLALRSFSSIYDRLLPQADDRIVDAITALEALWKLDMELSFRLAFRTSSLLAHTDDERVSLFIILSNYYKIRSKVVHGSSLTDKQEAELRDDEPLRDIVRRCLRAFLHLAVNPGEWTLGQLEREADTALMHQTTRESLQKAMAL